VNQIRSQSFGFDQSSFLGLSRGVILGGFLTLGKCLLLLENVNTESTCKEEESEDSFVTSVT
jgi:hypothetical protein